MQQRCLQTDVYFGTIQNSWSYGISLFTCQWRDKEYVIMQPLRNEIVFLIEKWVEIIMLSKTNQTWKDKCHEKTIILCG